MFWASIYQTIKCLTTKSCDVSKQQDWILLWSYHSEIWQTPQQHCCWSVCQILKWLEKSKLESCSFQTSRVRPFNESKDTVSCASGATMRNIGDIITAPESCVDIVWDILYLIFNSLWPSGAIWWHRSGSTLAQLIWLVAWQHWAQCWFFVNWDLSLLWHAPENNFTQAFNP